MIQNLVKKNFITHLKYLVNISPGGGIGRRKGLKPPRLEMTVRVQFPSWAHQIES